MEAMEEGYARMMGKRSRSAAPEEVAAAFSSANMGARRRTSNRDPNDVVWPEGLPEVIPVEPWLAQAQAAANRQLNEQAIPRMMRELQESFGPEPTRFRMPAGASMPTIQALDEADIVVPMAVPPAARASYGRRKPMASRIKYNLLRKGYGLFRKYEKLAQQGNSGKYINNDGSVRKQYVRLPGGGGQVMPLHQAQLRSVKRKMGALSQDVKGFGFGNYLLNQVTSPPLDYQLQHRVGKNHVLDMDKAFRIGSLVLK